MSISEKKRLSEKKELFLAICLISGEISSETIRRMKADFGDTQIKNNVIQSLRKDGYIKRVNRKNAGYGYQLTSSGLAYMKIKFPERYEYDLFSESKAYTYDENVRYNDDIRTAICWTLSPTTIIEAFDLCNPDVIGEDEVGFLCFEESVDILKRLFKRHRASDLIKFGQLSKEEAMPLLKDKNKE